MNQVALYFHGLSSPVAAHWTFTADSTPPQDPGPTCCCRRLFKEIWLSSQFFQARDDLASTNFGGSTLVLLLKIHLVPVMGLSPSFTCLHLETPWKLAFNGSCIHTEPPATSPIYHGGVWYAFSPPHHGLCHWSDLKSPYAPNDTFQWFSLMSGMVGRKWLPTGVCVLTPESEKPLASTEKGNGVCRWKLTDSKLGVILDYPGECKLTTGVEEGSRDGQREATWGAFSPGLSALKTEEGGRRSEQ